MLPTAPVNTTLATFLAGWRDRALPTEVTHEAGRALLNSLGASVGACGHPAVTILREWSLRTSARTEPAHLHWFGDAVSAEQAALVNTALMHVLDFDDTHLATYCHAAPPVFAAVLAEAERLDASGAEVLQAAVLGIEVELLVARALFPSHYLRGNHISATAGAVGAAAACSVLSGLDAGQIESALGLAMASAAGLIETIGTMGNAYGVGNAARTGVVTAWLAGHGLTTAPTVLEGEKGMLRAGSDETNEKLAALTGGLGRDWQILANSYKYFATETITQAPLECVFNVLRRIEPARRAALAGITLKTAPIVVDVVRQRGAKIGGGPPADDLEAMFDIRYCVAAAWLAGDWTHEQLLPAAVANPLVRALRERIDVVGDAALGVEDADCVFHFDDGTAIGERVLGFRGSSTNPMSDDELRAKFTTAAAGRMTPAAAEEVVEGALSLGRFGSCREFVRLLRLS